MGFAKVLKDVTFLRNSKVFSHILCFGILFFGYENLYRGQMADLEQSEIQWRGKKWHGDENKYRGLIAE